MVSRNFYQDCLVDVKPPPTTICPVTQDTPMSSSISVLGGEYDFNKPVKLPSSLRQKLEEHIGFNFQDFAIIAISNQGITVHPSIFKHQQNYSSCTVSENLKSPVDLQPWSNTQFGQKYRVPNEILQELSDLHLSRNEDQCGVKIDTDVSLSLPKEYSVAHGLDHLGGAQKDAVDASKAPNSVSDPLTSTDVIVISTFDFEIRDCEKLAKFYQDFLSRLPIRDLKTLVKIWVNHFCGREKQMNYTHGYKPSWWPKEVKFASTNSLVKRDLVSLATSILCFRDDSTKRNIESLAQKAKGIRWEETNKGKMFGEKVTAEVLRVAKIHEDYEAGKTDGSTMVHVEALTRPKEIRGPRLKKRNRSAIEQDFKASPLGLLTNINSVETIGSDRICGKVTSPIPEKPSNRRKDSTIETNAEEQSCTFSTGPQNYVQSPETEAASEKAPYQEKRRMLYHNGLQLSEMSSTSKPGVLPIQDVINGFMMNTSPHPVQREEQFLMFDGSGIPEMAGAGCLTMPMDLEARAMATSSATETLNIDFTNNNSSSNSNCSSCSNCNNANSYWMHGHEIDMEQFHSNDRLTYPSEVGNEFDLLSDEMDCVFNGRASFCDINHFNMKRRNNDTGLQPCIPNTCGIGLPVKHTRYFENGSYSGDDVINAGYSLPLYSSKFPLSPEGAGFTSRQQQQQQQQQSPYDTSCTAVFQSNSNSNISSFDPYSVINDMIPLGTL